MGVKNDDEIGNNKVWKLITMQMNPPSTEGIEWKIAIFQFCNNDYRFDFFLSLPALLYFATQNFHISTEQKGTQERKNNEICSCFVIALLLPREDKTCFRVSFSKKTSKKGDMEAKANEVCRKKKKKNKKVKWNEKERYLTVLMIPFWSKSWKRKKKQNKTVDPC